ncbi:hypothetical protein M8R50_16605 [Enterobacter bugandensis]|uniref:hypothetical protein n=1 Tax=Enterobacter bugandensis TaxID=881260 RepID=UPI0020762BC0|nr:hypothetical protein [Enterobacter bugandensis]MCM7239175.1 hypothetical protein [Enterobacter bugandensis]MCM7319126.1 hypothetical protein [Enterobacter bugandensis]MCM7354547.1 hypothetical protein [Enterobacter bugandensis]
MEKSERDGIKILSPSVKTNDNGKSKTQTIATGSNSSLPRVSVLAQADKTAAAKSQLAFSIAKSKTSLNFHTSASNEKYYFKQAFT